MKNIGLLFFVTLLMACASFKNDSNTTNVSGDYEETQCTENIDSLLKVKVVKTAAEWEKELSSHEYYVLSCLLYTSPSPRDA